jgi:hypothetical protein
LLSGDDRPKPAPRWAAAAHGGTLGAAGVVLAVAARGQWFFGDEWDFVANRGLSRARHGLLVPHNEHWSTLPILAYRALFSLTGVHSYWPYIVSLIGLHLLAAHLLWRVLRRAGVDEVMAGLLTAGFAVLGAGSQNLLWAFQIGFVGSLVVAYALVLLLDRQPISTGRAVAGAVAGAVGLMVSGISVVAVVVAGIVTLARAGWRKALEVAVPPAAVYLVWLATFGSKGLDHGRGARGALTDLPVFVERGLINALGRPFDALVLGVALLIALFLYAVLFGRTLAGGPGLPALALAAGAVAMFSVIAVGRVSFHEPGASRYVYLGFGLLTPLLGVMVSDVGGRAVVLRAVSLLGTVTLVVMGVVLLFRASPSERKVRATIQRQLDAALGLVDRGEPTVGLRPDPVASPDLTMAELLWLRRHHGLPAPAGWGIRDELNAAVHLQVAAVHLHSGDCTAPPAAPGSSVLFRIAGPATLELAGDTRGKIVIWLASGDGLISGGPRDVSLQKGATRLTLVRRTPSILGIRVERGWTRVCFRAPVHLLTGQSS